MRNRSKNRYVLGTTRWCYLCGFKIPGDIVSPHHPLFGTIDHVIPVSKGGENSLENRRAAHNFCNSIKGDRALEDVDRYSLQGKIKPHLLKAGQPCTRSLMRAARERIGINSVTNHQKGKGHLPRSIQEWDNEGGFVGNRTAHYDEPPGESLST